MRRRFIQKATETSEQFSYIKDRSDHAANLLRHAMDGCIAMQEIKNFSIFFAFMQ